MPIILENLCRSFDGREVLSALNHRFPDGRITCIVGPSGCGKTTLLRIIMGLLPPDAGQVSGVPSRMSAVFQEDRLIEHLSAAGNLRAVLRRGFPERELSQALQAVGLDPLILQPVRTLSGGQKRRVAILRAVLTDAPLVLMDEPFKGLDSATRQSVVDFILPRLSGRTVLLVSHDPSEAELLGAELFDMSPAH